ncbi:hypothetical protein [Streptomyces sp. NPDC018045]|uniref:hypothetical protein n=1 Tax=Streptomyces sp. NPDC018045 TaxID=3365037 RepID=UPI003788204D
MRKEPLKVSGNKEYPITLTDEDWSTLAAVIVIQRRRSRYAREIDQLGGAFTAIVRGRRDGTVWLRGSELHWIGAMNASGHRYSDDVERIKCEILSQLESVEA